ncbi:MAG: TAT-variant-translocated molybdopterin oxidoreductase [Myxococcota bacterium]
MSDTKKTRRQWRSLEELASPPGPSAPPAPEFTPDAAELEVDGVSRRKFMGLMGASAALAGTGIAGCVRKPAEHIMPFARRPEDRIPGRPNFYATAFQLGAAVQALVVESQDGRPTKIEGNPEHPGSLGAASTYAQASILGLYDPERSTKPYHGEQQTTWKKAWAAFDETLAAARDNDCASMALVVESVVSPTFRGLLSSFKEAFPQVRIVVSDPAWPANARAGAALAAGDRAAARYDLEGAKVVVSLDSDFLHTEGDAVAAARHFSDGRRVEGPKDEMNRLYAVGPMFSVTAAMADHRLAVKGTRVGDFLQALASELLDGHGMNAPGAAGKLGDATFDAHPRGTEHVKAIAKDLLDNRGRSVVVVGERQPAWVHALGHMVNTMIGADGKHVHWYTEDDLPELHSVAELAEALDTGDCDTVIVLGANPAYTAPADLELGDKLSRAEAVFHAGTHRDETARVAHWHLPTSHYLESWGDLRAADGTVSIVQPLIAPLHKTSSILELAARIVEGKWLTGHDLVKGFWQDATDGALSDENWRRWLHRGVADLPAREAGPSPTYQGLAGAVPGDAGDAEGFEIDFILDPTIFDGRFANNGWLQEIPDPITKLTWDNAALIAPKTAGRLGVTAGDMLTVSHGGRSLELPAWPTPGVAEDTVVLPLGYGRKSLGVVAADCGFDTYTLRTTGAQWFASGASVTKAAGTYTLATTQHHDTLEPGFGYDKRPMAREATLAEYREHPKFVEDGEILEPEMIRSPFEEPALTGKQQWGMSIDLNACIGCNACTVACNSENNIPVVGKERVLEGREMHWIRIDRYYVGDDPDQPDAVVQPVPCMQCENAPCETVCPVAATTHSPDGLNDMAYNRCIGTRYCANNCPFKVRRFNFFNFNQDVHPLHQMQKNPDVTVRFRGVMEKCTYCVQRINQAQIDAKVDGDGVVEDGAIQTACQQTCPTGAIVFGDVADPDSRVSRAKKQPRDYVMMSELNVKPRTSYLAKLRNPNPELV